MAPSVSTVREPEGEGMTEEATSFLVGKYSIEYESRNWILKEPITRIRRETKEEYDDWEVVGYYDRPEAAIRSLARLKITKLQKRKLEDLADHIDKALAQVTRDARKAFAPEETNG